MGELPLMAWLILALFAYALVTAVLTTLARNVRNRRERHDLLLAAQIRRKQYFNTRTKN